MEEEQNPAATEHPGAKQDPAPTEQPDVEQAPTAEQPQSVEMSCDSIVLSPSAEYACYLAKTKQLCWAVTNFKAPFYEPTSRAPVDIVAVIDKSGSMRGSKIDLVRKTLLFVIDQCKFTLILAGVNGVVHDYDTE